MDLCYSDTLADFAGCFFNYQMNLYLSRGLDPDEYLKIFSLRDPDEIHQALDRRHKYGNYTRALVVYRDFCKAAFFQEKEIRDFYAECFRWVRWCVENTDLDKMGAPFPSTLTNEMLQDLCNIVYRDDSQGKIHAVMRQAHVILQTSFQTGTSYLALEGLFLEVMSDWDVNTPYVGDNHGQRLRKMFSAQSIGNQKSANAAMARGFHAFLQALPQENKYPRGEASTHFPRVNSFIWFVTNPLRVDRLEQEVIENSVIVKVSSKADFFDQFTVSTPDIAFESDGPIREQRIGTLVALAAGKNFAGTNPGIILINCAQPDDVQVFSDRKVHDWLQQMVRRDFATDLDAIGRKFREGQHRPGIFIDKVTLNDLLKDEETIKKTLALQGGAQEEIAEVSEEAWRETIVGLAPKHLQGQTVGGEPPSRKRKRQVDTGEKGSVKKPFGDEKVLGDADPKEEADNSTLFYGVVGIGTFLGIMFLSRA